MVVQPSKTRLLGYKSSDVSEREREGELPAEAWRVSQPTFLLPPVFISPLVSAVM